MLISIARPRNFSWDDAAPEFHAKAVPKGTAPKENLFAPNAQAEVPGQANNPNINKDTWTDAPSTITGATSGAVHTGIGKPAQGQTSSELRDGRHERTGLTGVGADQNDPIRERGMDIDFPKGTKGKSGVNREDIPGAEERLAENAETIASKTK